MTVIERKRYAPKKRRESILSAAMIVASQPGGWLGLKRSDVARQAGCSDGLVSQYFSNMKSLKHVIMVAAIKQERLEIIAQGYVSGHLTNSSLSEALRDKTVKYLIHGS